MTVSEKIKDPRYTTILRKTRDNFMRSGIRRISMDDVSRDLRISKKTLYLFFLNKHDLVSKVLDFEFDEVRNFMQRMKRPEMNAIDELLEMSQAMAEYMGKYNAEVTSDLQKYYPDLFKRSQEIQRNYALDFMVANMKKGITQGIYREDLNIDLVAKLYIQKLEDLHDPSYFNAEQIPFKTVFNVMFENHIRGISNARGIKYFEKKKRF